MSARKSSTGIFGVYASSFDTALQDRKLSLAIRIACAANVSSNTNPKAEANGDMNPLRKSRRGEEVRRRIGFPLEFTP